jgi:hypothetical protein
MFALISLLLVAAAAAVAAGGWCNEAQWLWIPLKRQRSRARTRLETERVASVYDAQADMRVLRGSLGQ